MKRPFVQTPASALLFISTEVSFYSFVFKYKYGKLFFSLSLSFVFPKNTIIAKSCVFIQKSFFKTLDFIHVQFVVLFCKISCLNV